MEDSYLKKIIQCYFLDNSFNILSLTVEVKITDLSILCKWENLKNWQRIKYLFAPLYIFRIQKTFKMAKPACFKLFVVNYWIVDSLVLM